MAIVKNFQFTSKIPVIDVKTKITHYVSSKGGRLEDITEHKIKWAMGSGAKVRYWGGVFSSNSTLPVQIEIIFLESGDVTRFEITFTDTLGSGSRWGLKSKYKTYFTQLYSEILTLLS